MKVSYNNKIPFTGIGIVPWSRLGPDIWFDDYTIVSMYGWDVPKEVFPRIHAVADSDSKAQLRRNNSRHLLEHAGFRQILAHHIETDSYIFTYKPIKVPPELSRYKFLQSNQHIAPKLENKVQFRQYMADKDVRMPKYTVYERSNLTSHSLTTILSGRSTVILQDESLSAGKGTFLIRDQSSLEYALQSLETMSKSKLVIVSDYIEHARERSVQAVVTQYGTFVGPLQKQIIANPLLANLQVQSADKFCGAEISQDDTCAGAYPEIKQYALRIGDAIQSMGYRGIFSVDCLVDTNGTVYVLEINPRLTGITPLLTMLYRQDIDIPFYLLHMLELAGEHYTVEDNMMEHNEPLQGSLLVMHMLNMEAVTLSNSIQSGLYTANATQFKQTALRLGSLADNQTLVQQYMHVGSTIQPGGRYATVYGYESVLDANDNLTECAKQTIENINKRVKTVKNIS